MSRSNASYTLTVTSAQLFKTQILYLSRAYFTDPHSQQIRKTREEL
jgi:hypothetical protein